jgi:hypothetical protein
MRKFFTIFFALLPLAAVASEKADFKNYYLRGEFKSVNLYGDFYEKHYFNIYDNMIFNDVISETAFIEKFPDGEFELLTENNSKIRVNVTNGRLNSLVALDEESFRRNEKKVGSFIYCEKGFFYAIRYYIYGEKQYRNIAANVELKYPDGRIGRLSDAFYMYREGDKYIILEDYGEETLVGPIPGNAEIWFDAKSGRLVDNLRRRYGNESEEHTEPTVLRIKDCLLLFHNEDYVKMK